MTEDTQGDNTNSSEIRRCVRCVMPEGYPGITFDVEGVCNFCHYFDAKWGPWVNSFYLDKPEEMDDPYRFFGW